MSRAQVDDFVLCCLVSTDPGYRLCMAFQDSCHAHYSIPFWVLKVGAYEMGIQIGYFLPTQKKPGILHLMSSQVGLHQHEVVEGVEPRAVISSCSIRAIVCRQGF